LQISKEDGRFGLKMNDLSKKDKDRRSQTGKKCKERLDLFYVLLFSPLARHRKLPNPRKLG